MIRITKVIASTGAYSQFTSIPVRGTMTHYFYTQPIANLKVQGTWVGVRLAYLNQIIMSMFKIYRPLQLYSSMSQASGIFTYYMVGNITSGVENAVH